MAYCLWWWGQKELNSDTVQASSVSNFAFRFLRKKKSFMHGNDRYTEVLQSCQKPQHFHNCFLTKSSAVYLFRKLVGSYFTSDLVQNCTSQQQGFEYICDSMVKNAKMCHISTFRIYIDITTYNNYANSIYLHM